MADRKTADSDIEALLAQRAELDRQIESARKAAREEAIAQVRALMSQYGLTLADLGPRPAAAPRGAGKRTVAPKFRHPETGETWSGRGLKPRWLQAALDAGRSIEDFRV